MDSSRWDGLTGSAMKSMVGKRTDPVITSRSSRARDLDKDNRHSQPTRKAPLTSDPGPLPALGGFGRHEEGEERLRQPPQVEQLVSAAAQSHMKVGAVLLQSRLLQGLAAPRCAQARATASAAAQHAHVQLESVLKQRSTFLTRSCDHLHVLQRSLQHLISAHSRNVHLPREGGGRAAAPARRQLARLDAAAQA